jgi:uncharacterized protein VirK/YbjX
MTQRAANPNRLSSFLRSSGPDFGPAGEGATTKDEFMGKGIQSRGLRPAGWGLRAPRVPGGGGTGLVGHFVQASAAALGVDEPLHTRLAMILRSSRVFLFLRTHRELLRLAVYADNVLPTAPRYDLFHHLGRRYYLSRDLGLRERVAALAWHYRFEEAHFDSGYKLQVYRAGGLLLWSREVDGVQFSIRLALGYRYAAEGDLSISLLVGRERLHSISFSWTAPNGTDGEVSLFVTANQGRWRKDHEFLDSFNRAFPQNSPSYVCYAALQGVARSVGASDMRTVASRLQVCWSPDKAAHFEHAYDAFWEAVGGQRQATGAYCLPVPQPMKPLSEIAAKHRKRTQLRRALLQAVSESAAQVVGAHLRTAQGMPA